jgi:hypothetical protein
MSIPLCPACGGDLSIGHNEPCAVCRTLWEPSELDSRGQCPICDGQLNARLGLKLVRPQAQLPAVPSVGGSSA